MTTVPSDFVVASWTSLVPRSFSTSFAPGMTPPDASDTVTFSEPVDKSCALPRTARETNARRIAANAKAILRNRLPVCSCQDTNRDTEKLILRLHKDKQEHRQRIRVDPVNTALLRAYKLRAYKPSSVIFVVGLILYSTV